jgi:hypothetical protein
MLTHKDFESRHGRARARRSALWRISPALATCALAAFVLCGPVASAWAARTRARAERPAVPAPHLFPKPGVRPIALISPLGGQAPAGRRCEPSYCPKPPLRYKGGLVQLEPEVHLIFWGSNWNESTASEAKEELLNLFDALSMEGASRSGWQATLTQYGDEGGAISQHSAKPSSWVDTRIAAPSNLNPDSVAGLPPTEEEIEAAITANGWERTTDAQFVVLPAPGSTYAERADTDYCAFHWEENHGSVWDFVPYIAEEPFLDCEGYDPANNAANVESTVASHEYAEAATDPFPPTGWVGQEENQAEISDICASGDESMTLGTSKHFYVQGLWDNDQYDCAREDLNPELSAPDIPAIYQINPSQAKAGEEVTISGSALTGATAVKFGSLSAGGLVVHSDDEITATAPSGGGGTVVVTVATPGGSTPASSSESANVAPAQFTFERASFAIEKLQKISTEASFTKFELIGKVGEVVDYEITITNTGSLPLKFNKFSDPKCSTVTGGPGSKPVEPGASSTYKCEHKLTVSGAYSNEASVESSEGLGTLHSNTVTTTVPRPQAPAVETKSASESEQTGARLNATVNPKMDNVTKCTFEYGTSTKYGSSAPCAKLPGAGDVAVAVSVAIKGLKVNTTYDFRISAINSAGTSKGATEILKTAPALTPSVETSKASEVKQVTATLNAQVNPNLAAVSKCTFEYGTSTKYGASASCAKLPGAGDVAVEVSVAIKGLKANATYDFRISATNSAGTSKGANATLNTQAPAAGLRAGNDLAGLAPLLL